MYGGSTKPVLFFEFNNFPHHRYAAKSVASFADETKGKAETVASGKKPVKDCGASAGECALATNPHHHTWLNKCPTFLEDACLLGTFLFCFQEC